MNTKPTHERVQKLLKFFNKYNATKSVLEKSEHHDILCLLKNKGSETIEKVLSVSLVGTVLSMIEGLVFNIPVAIGAGVVFGFCTCFLLFFNAWHYKKKTDAFFQKHFAKSKFVKHNLFHKLFAYSEIKKTKDARLKFFSYVLNSCTPEEQQQIYDTCTKLSRRHNTFFWEHSLNILNKNAIKWSEIEKMFSQEKSVVPSATVMVNSEDVKMNSDDEKYVSIASNGDSEQTISYSKSKSNAKFRRVRRK